MSSVFACILLESRILRFAVDLEIQVLIAVFGLPGVDTKLVMLVLCLGICGQDALT
jgi:hypothetical protein